MKLFKLIAVVAVICAAVLPTVADRCELNFISHGTFRDIGGCLHFEDALGDLWEVVNPRGNWRDGATGTVHAQFETVNSCSQEPPLRVCTFVADFTKNVTGTLIIRQLIECPGYIIDTPNQDYRIENCNEFGTSLCDPSNLGRKIQAEVFVETGPSICLGLARSTVLEFRFIQ